MTPPLHSFPATELSRLLRAGEVSSLEIVQSLHARADEVEPRVGAFAHQFRKRALEQARAAEGSERPLDGLSLTIKESIDTEGVPTTLGMRARRGRPAARDAVAVRIAREAGAILLGKTNVPQTLLAPMETTNALFGTTHNPWRHGFGPGGSTGGEAAAIASGMSLFGFGTDIGGSIRAPSSFCGICGLKPTVHRWSNRGSNTALAGQELVQSQIGPMARTVDDLVLLMRALDPRKHAMHDPRVPPLPLESVGDLDPRQLRVGFYEDDGFFTPAASVRRAVREAAEMLERAGVKVVRFPPINVEENVFTYLAGISSDGTATLERELDGEPFIQPLRTLGRIARMPRRARQGVSKAVGLMGEARVERMLDVLGEKRVEELWRLTATRTRLILEEREAWAREGIDVVLAPTYVTPACRHGLSHDFTLGFVNLARYSLLNRPAGVVPITRVRPDETIRSNVRDRLEKRAAQIEGESAGLPVGVQVVGNAWREHEVLAIMRLLEREARQGESFPKTPVDPD